MINGIEHNGVDHTDVVIRKVYPYHSMLHAHKAGMHFYMKSSSCTQVSSLVVPLKLMYPSMR